MKDKKLLSDIKEYLKCYEDQVLEDWYELIRHISVSETGEGIETCCDWIQKKMEEIGIQVTKYSVKPAPVLVGRFGNDPEKKTVLIYAHYDVKPAGERKLWHSDPFVPTVRDGKVYARGSADNKSPLMAHLKALEYFIRRKMEVPVNVIFVFEGDEECGSRGLEEFLAEHRTELAADLVFFSDGPKDPSGLPIIALGAKGDLSIHITVETMNRNVHARYAPVLPSAAWQLVEILGKCRSKDKILMPGFEEGILPFTKKEIEIMNKLPKSEDSLNTIYEAKSSNYGKDFYPRLLGQPTFNICWIKTGANGVVPAKAEALIDCRLVPDQDPEKVFQCIKRHVEMMGYDNVKIENDGYIPSSKTDVNTPYLPAVEEICRDIYGEYVIYPCRPSSAPDYLWTNVLKLPAIQVRWSDADSDNHAPNEHLSIKEYMDGIALTVCALQAVSEISEINEKD